MNFMASPGREQLSNLANILTSGRKGIKVNSEKQNLIIIIMRLIYRRQNFYRFVIIEIRAEYWGNIDDCSTFFKKFSLATLGI